MALLFSRFTDLTRRAGPPFFLVRCSCPGDDRVRRSSSRGSGVAAGGRLPAGGAGLLAGHRYDERLCVSFIAATGTELVGLVGRAAEQCRRLTFGRLDRAGCLGHVSFPSARFCLLAWQGARDVFTALFDRVPACLTELGKLVAARIVRGKLLPARQRRAILRKKKHSHGCHPLAPGRCICTTQLGTALRRWCRRRLLRRSLDVPRPSASGLRVCGASRTPERERRGGMPQHPRSA